MNTAQSTQKEQLDALDTLVNYCMVHHSPASPVSKEQLLGYHYADESTMSMATAFMNANPGQTEDMIAEEMATRGKSPIAHVRYLCTGIHNPTEPKQDKKTALKQQPSILTTEGALNFTVAVFSSHAEQRRLEVEKANKGFGGWIFPISSGGSREQTKKELNRGLLGKIFPIY